MTCAFSGHWPLREKFELFSCKNFCSALTICQLAGHCECPTGSRPFTVLEYLSPASCGGFICLRLVLTDLSRVQRITKVLSAVPKIFGGKLLTAHFFVDILAIFCTVMQISLHIRHLAPELCPMYLKMRFPSGRNGPAFFTGQRGVFVLLFPVYIICQIKQNRDVFCENFFKYFLRFPVLFHTRKKEALWSPSE